MWSCHVISLLLLPLPPLLPPLLPPPPLLLTRLPSVVVDGRRVARRMWRPFLHADVRHSARLWSGDVSLVVEEEATVLVVVMVSTMPKVALVVFQMVGVVVVVLLVVVVVVVVVELLKEEEEEMEIAMVSEDEYGASPARLPTLRIV